jgi:nucleoside 2-deoxyribosyltransferase
MYYVLHTSSTKKVIHFVADETKYEDTEDISYVGVKTLENLYPLDFSQRVDMTLLNLAAICDGLGHTIVFTNSKSEPNEVIRLALFVDKVDFIERNAEMASFFLLLSEMGLIAPVESGYSPILMYRISAKGWLRIQELQSKNKVIPQGFIAMWFDPKMDEAKEKIISAIEDSGYKPIIISDKEHNNQIVPEILYEIKRSAFLVADLTEHRNGVYYEAGYAHAFEKEVILTCREKDFEDRHFDVAQKNTIKWKDEIELYEKLMKRIEATVGKINK